MDVSLLITNNKLPVTMATPGEVPVLSKEVLSLYSVTRTHTKAPYIGYRKLRGKSITLLWILLVLKNSYVSAGVIYSYYTVGCQGQMFQLCLNFIRPIIFVTGS